jgi:hypothetical protein
MKSRTIQLSLGLLILALAVLACNMPGGEGAAPTAAPSAAGPAAPGDSPTAEEIGICPAVPAAPTASGLITAVTMAEDTSGDERTPVNPTTTFGPTATFHAVVSVVDAPPNTKLKAVWFAGDTDGVALCNKQIQEVELVTDGTRNIDFSLTPETTWPKGSFRVDIYTNDVLDQVVDFSVK